MWCLTPGIPTLGLGQPETLPQKTKEKQASKQTKTPAEGGKY
jgi:hypothetical protein